MPETSASIAKPRMRRDSNIFRVVVCSVISVIAMVVAVLIAHSQHVGESESPFNLLVIGYVTLGPLYTILYTTWTTLVYRKRTDAELKALVAADIRDRDHRLARVLGNGTINASIFAACVAVVITVASAAQSDFRGEGLYVLLSLVTVLASWYMMVFAFGQIYMMMYYRFEGEDMTFTFDDPPRFRDFLALSLMLSTMGASAPAQIVTRRGWRKVRTNVFVAFTFNTVILAMMVSLLYAMLTNTASEVAPAG